ncbi:restriction endonuclease subunit S [Sedimenticola selenatireducens]|uniref:Restriction endonuclease subunit S n=1 Tax=Sedimenticola selenatireducens TaxID=191960 RepID=A0A557SEN4_9GAMM|nr:restriction endonuclease subunit S [Sedimenticola selenatireducens]TVO75897.1 restriction endonuclease subunit S [Sedimenticola selenatireducens]TVT63756.1 MAG: restriction endonuclease subunit S [Sedimenticola selenatireducens]
MEALKTQPVVTNNPADLITDNIDIWTSAIKTRSASGRGSGKKLDLYGIKKLRELILELAVRGKLVPQDASDEPAPVLLASIASEKSQLVKEKKIPRSKVLPDVTDAEKPFELPAGWGLARLGNLTSKLGSGSTPRGGKNAYVETGIPFLRSQNVWNDGLKLEDIAYIPEETHQKMEKTKVTPGDVLLNITGASLGRSTIFPEELVEANVSQHVTIIRLIEPRMGRFVHLGILSPMVQRLVWGRQVGMAIEGLSKKVLKMFEFPIPPLTEQHRIVAKVDELMALCDQLEQQTEASIDAHATLVETLLATLTNSADDVQDAQVSREARTPGATAAELEQNWARMMATDGRNADIAGANVGQTVFDTLFTTDHSIDQLKQTVLQLAVMGKLVPQDPNDEPATVLLKKIAAEKAQLVKEKKIKKQKALPPIGEDEKPFALPQGWEWCRLDDYAYVFAGASFKSGDFTNTGSTKVIKITNAGVGELLETDDYLPDEFLDSHAQYVVRKGDLILALTRPYISTGLKISRCPSSYDKSLLNQRVAAIRLIDQSAFCFLYLKSSIVLDGYKKRFGGSGLQPNLKMNDVTDLTLAVPPTEEQHRIVTKVDQLMTLCDQLKARLQHAQETQLHLADAMVEQALIR